MSTSQSVHPARRSVLAVPGSSVKMLGKAKALPVDAVFCDLEDAVAPVAKEDARGLVVEALSDGVPFTAPTVAVRVNAWDTPWTVGDLVSVIPAAGAAVDEIILPKVRDAAEVRALDLILTQLEIEVGLAPGRIAIGAQIEDALGLTRIDAIASSSPRLQSLIFGPGDFMASMNMRCLVVGEQPVGYEPGDAYHHVLATILVAARAHGLQAIDGPWTQVRDAEGFRRSARRSAALGYDGKWVLHPDQVDDCNEIFSPSQAEFDRAEEILEEYARSLSAAGGARGAIMVGNEMVDEAGAKMAQVVSAKGRAGGMTRSRRGEETK